MAVKNKVKRQYFFSVIYFKDFLCGSFHHFKNGYYGMTAAENLVKEEIRANQRQTVNRPHIIMIHLLWFPHCPS